MFPTTGASVRCQVLPSVTKPPAVAATWGVTLAVPVEVPARQLARSCNPAGMRWSAGNWRRRDSGDRRLKIIFALERQSLRCLRWPAPCAGQRQRLPRLIRLWPRQAGVNDLPIRHDLAALVHAGGERTEQEAQDDNARCGRGGSFADHRVAPPDPPAGGINIALRNTRRRLEIAGFGDGRLAGLAVAGNFNFDALEQLFTGIGDDPLVAGQAADDSSFGPRSCPIVTGRK